MHSQCYIDKIKCTYVSRYFKNSFFPDELMTTLIIIIYLVREPENSSAYGGAQTNGLCLSRPMFCLEDV